MRTTLTRELATAVAGARAARGFTVSELARVSGVSRAMLARIERGDVQPTAVLLGRVAAALGLSLSELVGRAENADRRLARAGDQPGWRDPATGYRRRALSPVPGGALELVEVELPPRTEVSFPADAYALAHQQIWMLAGTLRFREDETEHVLAAGDCLALGSPAPCTFANDGDAPCRYLVALARR